MSLTSFRELLARKAEGNPGLQALIKNADEDYIFDLVTEALEKMAKPAGHKGDTANNAVRTFAHEMDADVEPEMIRDALGHHASHYKAAIKAGNQDKANKHARKIWDLMNLSSMLHGKLSENKLSVDYPNPHPWDRHTKLNRVKATDKSYLNGNRKLGDFSSATEGFDWAGKDFSHLQYDPHPAHSATAKEEKKGNKRGYPLEQIKINGKHIPIDDEAPAEEDHPFDHHPIMEHYKEGSGARRSEKQRSPQRDAEYVKQRHEFENGPHVEKYFNKMQSLEEKDPEAFAQRGSKPSAPVHDKQVVPEHVKAWEEEQNKQAAPAAEAAPAPVAAAPEKSQQQKLGEIDVNEALAAIKAGRNPV